MADAHHVLQALPQSLRWRPGWGRSRRISLVDGNGHPPWLQHPGGNFGKICRVVV